MTNDLDEMERERAIDTDQQRKRVRLWVVAAIVVAIIIGLIVNDGAKHRDSYNAGVAWAKAQISAGYVSTDAAPSPCDDSQLVYAGSAGQNFTDWMAGCESVGPDGQVHGP